MTDKESLKFFSDAKQRFYVSEHSGGEPQHRGSQAPAHSDMAERGDGCQLCDGHKGCDNCYYGQIDKVDCPCYCDPFASDWMPLGDKYCRWCGRKLPSLNIGGDMTDQESINISSPCKNGIRDCMDRVWISVDDRLPQPVRGEQRGFFLVALSSGVVKELAYEFRHYDNMMFDVGWHETAFPVTHWRELPSPPMNGGDHGTTNNVGGVSQ